MPTGFVMRPLEHLTDYHQAEALQRRVWGFADIEVIPLHVLLTVQKNGGWALGAYRKEGEEMIGLLFGFPGRDALGMKHCSHILGVVPEARSLGVGAALKREQRRRVLDGGVPRVTWTFDPLLFGNAYLNFRKLGVVCRRYLHNIYGEIRGDLNRGMPTDRFEVDWWLESARVKERLAGGNPGVDVANLPEATSSRPAAEGHRLPEGWRDPDAPRVLVEIPTDLPALKRDDPGAPLAWRHLTREAFDALFADAYVATEVVRRDARTFYLLEHEPERHGGAA